jgi:hypothetical protein
MNRVDIIGVPGVGKTTFLKKYKFKYVEDEFYLKKKASITTPKSKLLLKLMPEKMGKSYIKSLHKDFYNGYEIETKIEARRKKLLKQVQEDQVSIQEDIFLQLKRFHWLFERLAQVEVWEDHFKGKENDKVILFDESLLHKLILFYVNLNLDNSHFLKSLSQIPFPEGLLVFKNDISVTSKRIIERRIKQNSGRPTDEKTLKKLTAECERYDELLDVAMGYFEAKVPLQVVDLRDDDEVNRSKIEKYFRSFIK